MSCLSCHTMHQDSDDPRSELAWANDQLKAGMDGNAACLQCHQVIADDLTGHTHHPSDSSGSSCYNCHMPHTTYGLLTTLRSHQITSPRIEVTQSTGRPNACNLCHLDRTLEWSGNWLTEWYGHERHELSQDEREIASSLRWMLKGNAAQRALIASAMNREAAQAVSGSEWMPIFLAQLLDDPYDAIRIIAHRSLRRLPGYSDLDYDFLNARSARRAAANHVVDTWMESRDREKQWPTQLLFTSDGSLDLERLVPLLQARDNSPIMLAE